MKKLNRELTLMNANFQRLEICRLIFPMIGKENSRLPAEASAKAGQFALIRGFHFP